MPGSAPTFKPIIRDALTSLYPPDCTVLDIGAGAGTYADLLSNHFHRIDGIEVEKSYVHHYNLRAKYHRIYTMDCRSFVYTFYDIMILGDVLEHLGIADAKLLVKHLLDQCRELIVAVPYLCKQGAVAGIESERHLQPDLTPAIMRERYPQLMLLMDNERRGIYVKPSSKLLGAVND